MTAAILNIGWSSKIAVPVDEVGNLLKILAKSMTVDSTYHNNETVYFVSKADIRIDLIDSAILPSRPETKEENE